MNDQDEVVLDVESSGVARCQMEKQLCGYVETGDLKLPVHQNSYGEVEGLPCPQAGYIFVVSMVVAQAVKDTRDDVFIPDDLVRDSKGRIIGCKGLARV
jgi:hypothetical protein